MESLRGSNRTRGVGSLIATALAVCLLAAPTFGGPKAPAADQETFASPEEAVDALKKAVDSLKQAIAGGDRSPLTRLFGPSGAEIGSGDTVADKEKVERFAKRLAKMSRLVKRDESKYVLFLGAENWPFPFPIVKQGDRWAYDGPAGLQEIIDRRVGENELTMIKVCRELARAQREYAEDDHDGDEVLEFAQKFNSTANMHDGLYWPDEEDSPESPLGPMVAYAEAAGYNPTAEGPQPFHGYYFQILTRQGASAPGGAYNYLINGNMIGGFAIVAYPAEWADSGLMTFVVGRNGKVYQKDLGPQTAALAKAMRSFNPDKSWQAVEGE